MLSIFSIPKPFQGHINKIQRNAIQSWIALEPKCEIMIFGDEEGVTEISNEFNLIHLPDIPRNQYSTPFLSAAFEIAEKKASNQLLCFINSDIILTSNIIQAVTLVTAQFKKFLMVGCRWNLEEYTKINFEDPNWEIHILNKAIQNNKVSSGLGSDYFIYPKNTLGTIEPFLIGRPGWDNWMMYHARKIQIPLIDSTKMILPIHQNHHYLHIAESRQNGYEGPEADYNRSLIPKGATFTLKDASHTLDSKGLLKVNLDDIYLERRIKNYSLLSSSGISMIRTRKLRIRLLTKFMGFCSKRYKATWWRQFIYKLTY